MRNLTDVATLIGMAKESDIDLRPSDFKRIDGHWTLDGMDPLEWLEAMTQ